MKAFTKEDILREVSELNEQDLSLRTFDELFTANRPGSSIEFSSAPFIAAYEYGFHGNWRALGMDHERFDDIICVYLMLDFILTATDNIHAECADITAIRATRMIAEARFSIDKARISMEVLNDAPKQVQERDISISEISLLANMQPQSVRNAISKAGGEFRTTKVGRETFISAFDAHKWLSKRRGYIATEGLSDPDCPLRKATVYGALQETDIAKLVMGGKSNT